MTTRERHIADALWIALLVTIFLLGVAIYLMVTNAQATAPLIDHPATWQHYPAPEQHA